MEKWQALLVATGVAFVMLWLNTKIGHGGVIEHLVKAITFIGGFFLLFTVGVIVCIDLYKQV